MKKVGFGYAFTNFTKINTTQGYEQKMQPQNQKENIKQNKHKNNVSEWVYSEVNASLTLE